MRRDEIVVMHAVVFLLGYVRPVIEVNQYSLFRQLSRATSRVRRSKGA